MNTEQIEAATTKLYGTGPKGQPSVGRVERTRQDQENRAAWQSWLHREHLNGFGRETADAVFRKAWEDGHSSGYREVEMHYTELADIVKTV